jgi:hypothetical protein
MISKLILTLLKSLIVAITDKEYVLVISYVSIGTGYICLQEEKY